MPDYQSTPHDGHHPLLDDGTEWRKGNDPASIAERFISYGNFAGPGNRLWNEGGNPEQVNDPKYAPIDGIDRAAQQHDYGYGRDLGAANALGWDGMHNVRQDDAKLVSDVQKEMDANGSQYSSSATRYSEGMRGFFEGRVSGENAVDFAGAKAHEAGQGISGFVDSAKSWHSVGDAANGVAGALGDAGHWLADTGGQAMHGVADTAKQVGSWGVPGALGAVAGLGDVAVAGAGHAASKLWNWIAD